MRRALLALTALTACGGDDGLRGKHQAVATLIVEPAAPVLLGTEATLPEAAAPDLDALQTDPIVRGVADAMRVSPAEARHHLRVTVRRDSRVVELRVAMDDRQTALAGCRAWTDTVLVARDDRQRVMVVDPCVISAPPR